MHYNIVLFLLNLLLHPLNTENWAKILGDRIGSYMQFDKNGQGQGSVADEEAYCRSVVGCGKWKEKNALAFMGVAFFSKISWCSWF